MPNWMLLWVILICYIIGGCVMDALAFLLVSLPIFYPLVMQLGYDPIWFGQVIMHRHDHGLDHAAHRDLLLRRGGHGKGYTPVDGLPRGAVLYTLVYHLDYSADGVAVLDGARPIELGSIVCCKLLGAFAPSNLQRL